MKKFIIRICAFIFPIIIIAVPLDIGISYLLSQSHQSPGNFEVWSDIYKENSNAKCDIAIYGSSRAWVHINPEIITDSLNGTAYNFGIDGHNFWLQYLRHLELLKNNKKPKKIILSVDVFTLQKRTDLYQLEQFLPYMLWNNNIKEYTSSYIGFSTIDYFVPLVRYAGQIEAIKTSVNVLTNKESKIQFRKKGFFSRDEKWNSSLEDAKAKIKSYKIKLDPQSIVLFEKFIQECNSINIDLVLVYTPEYIEGQKFVLNRNEIITIYDNFSKKYDLKFYDYSNDAICLDKRMFYNASHLNKRGADTFTKKLANDLKTEYYKSN